jgi:mRNA-degrading endonuclease toxin of MazEF toxin-antitoxin module
MVSAQKAIMCNLLAAIEKTRLGDKCGMLNQDKMAEVDKAIKRSLGLDG